MRLLFKLGLSAAFILVAMAVWLWQFSQTPLIVQNAPHVFSVKPGSNIRIVARQLAEEGILKEPWGFSLMARLTGRAEDLKAGNYQIDNSVTPYQLFEILTNGDVSQVGITFIEGWTFWQMREELNRHANLRHLTMAMSDAEILQRIGAGERHPEGLFFPDTYFFSEGMSDLEVLERAYVAMQFKLEQAWKDRAPELPYQTPYQALIMASIVEKETGQRTERPMIASVFINRLKLGMRLQTDPTVIYGMGPAFDGNLRRKDLLEDNAYNTYTRAGLPPTPISNPGLEAIEAVLHPDQSAYLYFVGKGDGSHVFSRTLTEHNRAVARFQLGRK